MQRLRNTLRGFLIGLVGGGMLGALGGTLDRGSMFILVPSGPPFWGLLGAFAGSIVGALGGALLPSEAKAARSGSLEGADAEAHSGENNV